MIGAKMAPAAMFSASKPRHVPRMAPSTLFSSKESIPRLQRKFFRQSASAPIGAAHKYPVCLRNGNPYNARGTRGRRRVHRLPETLIVIPARMASTRLPGKPLAQIAGEPMIVHVLRCAQAARVGPVVVATDSQEIADCVEKAGGRAVMTRADHVSGSDRVFEALAHADPHERAEVVVNLQGDLPTLASEAITAAIE